MKGSRMGYLVGSVDPDGVLTAHVFDEDLEKLESGETELHVDLTIEGQPANLNIDIPVDILATDRGNVKTLTVDCPAWLTRKLNEAKAGGETK